jgi:hypothetical protein
MKHLVFLVLAAALTVVAFGQTAKEPLYVLLYARITDHVNADISEDRLRRLLPMIETYRNKYPAAHVSAAILFSGASSRVLAERNAKTQIVDFVKDYIKRGVIEVGYDGTDEPTYATRPIVDLGPGASAEERWRARWAGEQKFLTEGRDPLTGAPETGKTGGLKKMQEVFGEATWVTGIMPLMRQGPGGLGGLITSHAKEPIAPEPNNMPLPIGLMPEVGGDTEATILVQQYAAKAVMFGVANDNPARLPGFRGGRAGFSDLISPISATAPEVYWQDNVLRSSETSNEDVHLLRGSEGPEALQKLTAKADRSKVHVIHIELGSEQDYLRPEFVNGPEYPALKYAYDHSQSPKLPAEALRSQQDVNTAFASQEALLKWAAGEFFPAEPGSRIIASGDLVRMASPGNGYSVSMKGLRASLDEYMKAWGTNTYGPAFFKTEGHYLSRAELFQVMADALAEFDRTGKIPDSVQVDQVYGPVRVLTGHGPNAGEVSVAALAHICTGIAPALHDKSAASVPKNTIPIGISVEGAMLNPAQFLRLMALALQNTSAEAKLNIRMTYQFTGPDELIPKSRALMDDGFAWTLKPAPLERAVQAQANR